MHRTIISHSFLAEMTALLGVFDILDLDKQPLAAQDLTSLTLTLYDRTTDTTINGRERSDILNVNGGFLTTPGKLKLILDVADMLMIGSGDVETHVALIEWTFSGKERGFEVVFTVERLNRPA